jgi:transcriptional regulator with XRE-family HTH domain
LRAIRERLGLSQQQMAHRLGLHRNTVNRYERGARRVPRVVAIAARSLSGKG